VATNAPRRWIRAAFFKGGQNFRKEFVRILSFKIFHKPLDEKSILCYHLVALETVSCEIVSDETKGGILWQEL
jgi:hypothetical protein